MRLDYLKYFIDTADMLSIKAAAKKNCISPQGMSKALRSIETDLGFELFNRGSNNIVLTRCGKEILPAAKRVAVEYDAMMAQAEEMLRKDDIPHLVIYCSMFVFVSGMIGRLRSCVNEIGCNVEYVQMKTDSTIEILRRGGSQGGNRQLGVVIFFSQLAHENFSQQDRLKDACLAYRPYLQYSDHLLVSKSSPLAEKRACGGAVSKDELRALPVISSSGEQSAALRRYLGDGSIDTYIEDLNTRIQLVHDGQGGILVPPFAEFLSGRSFEGLALVPLEKPYIVELGFIGTQELLNSRLLLSLISKLNEYYRPLAQAGLCHLL